MTEEIPEYKLFELSKAQYILKEREKRDLAFSLALKHVLEALEETQQAAKQLVLAQGRMLDRYADGDNAVKEGLWRNLHEKGDACRKVLSKYNVFP